MSTQEQPQLEAGTGLTLALAPSRPRRCKPLALLLAPAAGLSCTAVRPRGQRDTLPFGQTLTVLSQGGYKQSNEDENLGNNSGKLSALTSGRKEQLGCCLLPQKQASPSATCRFSKKSHTTEKAGLGSRPSPATRTSLQSETGLEREIKAEFDLLVFKTPIANACGNCSARKRLQDRHPGKTALTDGGNGLRTAFLSCGKPEGYPAGSLPTTSSHSLPPAREGTTGSVLHDFFHGSCCLQGCTSFPAAAAAHGARSGGMVRAQEFKPRS